MLAINVIRPAWRREFAITCVAEMGLLFAYPGQRFLFGIGIRRGLGKL